jgi:glycosyltransferase involved in cell wall biosynthesis
MQRLMCDRHPDLAQKCSTILNGFDAELYVGLAPERAAPPGEIVVTHAGQFYGPRSPAVLFEAVRRASERSPAVADRLRLELLGPAEFDGRPLADLAKAAGVSRHVTVRGPMPHGQTLARLAGSDAVLVCGSTGPGAELQVPNKVFEYLALRRPILAVCGNHNPVRAILSCARAVHVCVQPDDAEGLARALEGLASGCRPEPHDAWNGAAAFDRAHRAVELMDVFASVTAGRAPVGDTRARLVSIDRRSGSTPRRTQRVPDERLQIEQGMDDDARHERTRSLVGVAEQHAEQG